MIIIKKIIFKIIIQLLLIESSLSKIKIIKNDK